MKRPTLWERFPSSADLKDEMTRGNLSRSLPLEPPLWQDSVHRQNVQRCGSACRHPPASPSETAKTEWELVVSCYEMLCCVMLCYVMACFAMLAYAMSCYVMLRYVKLCYVVSSCVIWCYVLLCYVSCCPVVLYCVVWCCFALRTQEWTQACLVSGCVILWYDMLWYVLCYVVPCSVVLCGVALRCVHKSKNTHAHWKHRVGANNSLSYQLLLFVSCAWMCCIRACKWFCFSLQIQRCCWSPSWDGNLS